MVKVDFTAAGRVGGRVNLDIQITDDRVSSGCYKLVERQSYDLEAYLVADAADAVVTMSAGSSHGAYAAVITGEVSIHDEIREPRSPMRLPPFIKHQSIARGGEHGSPRVRISPREAVSRD